MRTLLATTARAGFGAYAFAWTRIVIFLIVSAAAWAEGPSEGDARSFLLLMALGGVPASILLLLTVERVSPPVHAMASAAIDLAMSVALHVLIPEAAQVARLAYVLVPAATAVTAGFGPAMAVAVAGVVANAAIELANPQWVPGDFNPIVHLARLALATVLVYLVGRASSERRAAQASHLAASVKAETILSKVTSAVVVTDAKGRLREWNDAAQAVMRPLDGRAKGALTCQTALALHAGDRELDCSNGCGLLRLQEDHPDGELPAISRRLPDGRRLPLHADAAPILGPGGDVVEVVHSLLDVTRLKQADEAKTLFLATTSHELKTPLTVISGFAELLLSMPDLAEHERKEALETICRRARELSTIVDRLLLSSRIEAGRVQVNMCDVDLEPLVRERVEALEKTTGRPIRVAAQRPIPLVEADPAAVTTIVDHLLENAVRYSPGGEGVDVTVTPADGGVEIRIGDRGIGMDAEQQAHCFDRFWQAESSDVRRFGGTGIGLYIVKSLVEAMHGTIDVESAPGRGTTFTVRLEPGAHIDLAAGDDSVADEVERGRV